MKKKLGQNFLRNPEISEKIVELSRFENDIGVFEIGPGDGALTDILIDRFKNLTLLEFDSDLIIPLKNRYKKYTINIINDDARTYKIKSSTSLNVIGNLPYYASNVIIRNFMTQDKVNSMVFTVQKEVGEQIVAGPGKKSFLSLFIQSFCNVEKLLIIKNHEFYPIPKVDSMTVKLTPISNNIDDNYVEFLKKGFSNPRKKISNSLGMGLNLNSKEVKTLLDLSNVEENLRPQHLDLDNWKSLFKNYQKYDQI
ncbi:MAG: ribosomal RNA small subunit methyltransferase A [Chloroflexi bacterium]|nr:ribosomal RNA small subunit methyltransferase A [Chloroflexota bacterium]|tara:strand:- start:69765 stop:70523 length:759 start_codon:yes stop_codon:yes gene_type:complete